MIPIPPVIIVTGTPGTGKTTASRVLANRIHATHIDLSSYAEENECILRRDEKRDTGVVDMKKLSELIQVEVDSSEEPLILEGHYSHEVVNPADVKHVFVLRREPWSLINVLESRGYGGEKVWENLEAEILGVTIHEVLKLFPQMKITEIDTSNNTPMETVEEIIMGLESLGTNEFEAIDWVGEPETLRLLMKRPCTL